MDIKEWTDFFRKGHSRRSYTKRRNCARCGNPIADRNKSGYCTDCSRSLRNEGSRKKKNNGDFEGTEHAKLKELARDFLFNMGYTSIKTEHRIGTPPYSIKSDVSGVKGDKMAIVECGGSMRKKLVKASTIVDIIYIWPFGTSYPFVWEEEIVICIHCGHKN